MQRDIALLLAGIAIGLWFGQWFYELHAVSACQAAGGYYNYLHGWCGSSAGFDYPSSHPYWFRHRKLGATCLLLVVISGWLWARHKD